jgi:hypothetical protein
VWFGSDEVVKVVEAIGKEADPHLKATPTHPEGQKVRKREQQNQKFAFQLPKNG